MSDSNQFAVFQKESVGPTSDQLRRAFNSFTNLTDADAIRLANSARGILMKYMAHDAARALQLALQAEGVGVALVPESDVPRLPETRALHRLNLSPEALVTFDLLGRETKIPWTEIHLVAAGAVRHFEVSKTETERTVKRFGIGSKTVTDVTHKVESGSQLLLEIHLADGKTRFQIEAANFPFKYLIDQPSLSTLEKFTWLAREICLRATNAIFNDGARCVRENRAVAEYPNRQAFADEVVWLLWRSAH